MISIIILTKNEERDLPGCLEAVGWCTDIHVLDSGSTDHTVEIARKSGASVHYNPFESFGKQRNFALDNINLKFEWIFFLDADEIVTPSFKNAMIESVAGAGNDVAGFFCCWKMMLENRWLKRCDNFPKWQFRIMKRGMARFTDFGHGQKESGLLGRALYIDEPYVHFGFSKGWSHWLDRHNRYSTLEATSRKYNCPPFADVFARHGTTRNPALKSWLSRIPGWPIFRFIQAYFFNAGFIEGMPGLIYCINVAFYEYMVQIKMREIRMKDEVKPGVKRAGSVESRNR